MERIDLTRLYMDGSIHYIPQPKKYSIILNGPPGVGKDTVFEHLYQLLKRHRNAEDIMKFQFKDALYEETLRYFKLTPKHETLFIDRKLKEEPAQVFGGLSPREALIHVSENVIKPKHGKDYFGIISANKVANEGRQVNVFTDGGFIDEVRPLEQVSKVLTVQMHKLGYTFKGDSRGYITTKNTVQLLVEEGEVWQTATQLLDLISTFVNGDRNNA